MFFNCKNILKLYHFFSTFTTARPAKIQKRSPPAFLPRPLLRAGANPNFRQNKLAEFLRILFPRKIVSQKFVRLFILKIGSNLVQ